MKDNNSYESVDFFVNWLIKSDVDVAIIYAKRNKQLEIISSLKSKEDIIVISCSNDLITNKNIEFHPVVIKNFDQLIEDDLQSSKIENAFYLYHACRIKLFLLMEKDISRLRFACNPKLYSRLQWCEIYSID